MIESALWRDLVTTFISIIIIVIIIYGKLNTAIKLIFSKWEEPAD